MQITSKEDAIAMAEMRVEEDAQVYIREIESKLMLYVPRQLIKVSIPGSGSQASTIANYIVKVYAKQGWETKSEWIRSNGVANPAHYEVTIS